YGDVAPAETVRCDGPTNQDASAAAGAGAGLVWAMHAGLGRGDAHEEKRLGAHLSAPCTGPNQVPYEVSHAATEVTKPRSTTASVRGLLGGRGIGWIGGEASNVRRPTAHLSSFRVAS